MFEQCGRAPQNTTPPATQAPGRHAGYNARDAPWRRLPMTPSPAQHVLTLSCGDRPGIVGAVGNFLADRRCNIIDSAQFGDLDTGRFFMRVLYERLDADSDPAALAAAFEAIAARFAMHWAIHDAAYRPRVLIMVSKLDHCLNDLLYRYKIGALPMQPVNTASRVPGGTLAHRAAGRVAHRPPPPRR